MLVKIYKITCTRAFMANEQGTGYSLTPWGRNTPHYQGSDDGGREYVLPSSFVVGETKYTEKMIYQGDIACPLFKKYDQPAIVGKNGAEYILRQKPTA
jgi:hypothetical protein